MKAVTVWQPWASLVAIGAKPHEFRGHNKVPRAAIGSRIAIHAGQKVVRVAEMKDLLDRLVAGENTGLDAALAIPLLRRFIADPTIIPRGCIVATAILGTPVKAYELPQYAAEFVNDSDRDDHANYAWPLTEVVQLQPPVEAKGAQGFWNWNAA